MHGLRRRTAGGAALAALCLTLASGCGGDTKDPVASSDSKSYGTGKLTIGISFDQPGIGLKTSKGYEGFDVSTAKYVAHKLGVSTKNITWVEAKPADREKLITSGKVDMVVSSYSITDERKKQVAFAGPYFEAHQDLLVRRNDTDIRGPKTLNGRTLCSVTGTTSAQLVEKKYKGRITLKKYPEFSDCVKALKDGGIDAVTTDDVILAGFAAQKKYKGDFKVVGDGFSDEEYGIGLKKGDTQMLDKVNAALTSYVKDGLWKKALQAYVSPSGYSLPDAPTPGKG